MLSTGSVAITSDTVAELSPALLRFALRLVRQRDEAEDLLQETWFSALRSAPTFEGRSSLRTWLQGIMRRRAADRYRRRRAEPFEEQTWVVDALPALEQLEHRQAAALAARALAELPPLERAAVSLCDIEDLDRERAAERMRITRGHLRVLLHRGRQKLALDLRAHGVERAAG